MLNKTQLAQAFRFISDLLLQDVREEANAIPALAPNTGTAEATPPATKRPGRPRKTEQAINEPQQALPAEPETKVEPAPAPEPEKPKVTGGKTLDELRALINPLVLKARGPEVKAVLNKYAPEGHSGDYTLALLSERPDTHAAFAADIEALLI